MKHKILISFLVGAGFGGSYFLGMYTMSKLFKGAAKKIEPLFQKMMSDLITKVAEENMTEEEIRAYVQEQISFFNLVSKSLPL